MNQSPADGRHGTEPPALASLSVDRDAEVPIGVQLAWALRARIGDGELGAGQRLPGLRDLAEAIGVNLNTVRAVYQRLEHEGLIESQQGSGTFVAPEPPRGSSAVAIATTAARSAREAGVDPRDVAAALFVAPEPRALGAPEAADLSEVGQRRLLRKQIAAFESALGEIEAAHPGVAPPPERTGIGSGPALLATGELEQVRTSLVRRLTAVQSAIDEAGKARSKAKRAGGGARPATARSDAGQPATPKPGRPRRAKPRILPAGT